MSDSAAQEREVERYPQIVRAIRETPWAILPGTLATILDVVGRRLAGERFSQEEIEARVGSRASSRPTNVVGSVAVLPIYGAIIPRATMFSEMSGGTSIQNLSEDLRSALADEAVKAILLEIDSPGGMTDMVPEFAAELRASRGEKPIVAVANTRAASAAYWLAAQADEIVVTQSGDVGSIGVFAAHDDISGMQEKMGVQTTLVSAGKFKTEGNPFEPLDEAGRAAIQERVDEMYDVFTGDVAKGRGLSAEAVKSGYGEGRMLSAKKALAAGMVDRIDTFESTLQRLQNPSGRARVARNSGTAMNVTGGVVSLNFSGGGKVSNEAAEGGRFTDAVDEAHRALEAVVSGAEALRVLTGTKREQLTALIERAQELVATPDEAEDGASPDGLELEFAWQQAPRL